jgi:hypothetical protein
MLVAIASPQLNNLINEDYISAYRKFQVNSIVGLLPK